MCIKKKKNIFLQLIYKLIKLYNLTISLYFIKISLLRLNTYMKKNSYCIICLFPIIFFIYESLANINFKH